MDGVVRDALAEEMMYKLNHLKREKQKIPGMGNGRCKGPDGGKILEGLWCRRASVAGFSKRGREDTRCERPGSSLFSGISQH